MNPYSSLKSIDFRRYIASRFFITLAVQIQGVVVAWQIYDATKDPLSLGLIGLTEALPAISIALFAGYISDIANRKTIIQVSLVLLLFCSISLWFLTLNINSFVYTKGFSSILKTSGTIPVYTVIFISGIARGFLSPSASAFMPQIVAKDQYANAATWASITWQTAAVAGPAIGGLLYGFYGITTAYLVDLIFVLISILFISLVPPKHSKTTISHEPLFKSLKSGISFVFKNQIILGSISLDLFAVLFGGAVALLPIFANDILKVGPEGLGLLRSAPSVGAVTMALFLAYFPPHNNTGRNLLISVAGFGMSMILFALSTNFYLSLFLLVLSGMFDNVSVVIRSTIIQLLTPNNMRGRVSSINSIFIGSSNEIGAFESGVTAKLLGVIPSVVIGGTLTLIVVAISAKLSPRLRKLHLHLYI